MSGGRALAAGVLLLLLAGGASAQRLASRFAGDVAIRSTAVAPRVPDAAEPPTGVGRLLAFGAAAHLVGGLGGWYLGRSLDLERQCDTCEFFVPSMSRQTAARVFSLTGSVLLQSIAIHAANRGAGSLKADIFTSAFLIIPAAAFSSGRRWVWVALPVVQLAGTVAEEYQAVRRTRE